MNVLRCLVGVIGFLFVWFVVAVLFGLVMFALFPPRAGLAAVGVGVNWRNIPGTILGILAGWRSFRASVAITKRPSPLRRNTSQDDG